MVTFLSSLVLVAATVSSAPASPEIMIYAAASLRDAMQELTPACEAAAGVRLLFNFGASNELARQIEAANKADVFFSADEAWMDKVASAGLVDAGSRRSLLSNRLVVVAGPGVSYPIASAADLARSPARLISLANPDAVPAGKYARAWLEHQGQWESIAPRVLPGVDVRAALAAVEAGGAELGIVYATDAALSSKARVVYAVPEQDGPRIRYPIAALRDRPHLEEARKVVACISGPQGRPVFERFGFIVLEGQ
jgi:molybdate transport system substrate-binding protein